MWVWEVDESEIRRSWRGWQSGRDWLKEIKGLKDRWLPIVSSKYYFLISLSTWNKSHTVIRSFIRRLIMQCFNIDIRCLKSDIRDGMHAEFKLSQVHVKQRDCESFYFIAFDRCEIFSLKSSEVALGIIELSHNFSRRHPSIELTIE